LKTMQERLTERFRAAVETPPGRAHSRAADPAPLDVSAVTGRAANLGHWYVTRTDTLATVLTVRFDFQAEQATFTLSGPALDQADIAALNGAPGLPRSPGLPRGWITRPLGGPGRRGTVTVRYAEAARYGDLLAAVDELLAPYRPGGQANRAGGQA
jgi:hypothetical protein